MSKVYVRPGQRVEMILGHSEVCCHMRVAGKRAIVEVIDKQHPSAQIRKQDGTTFSAPILLGEAGFYEDKDGIYYYTPEEDAEWVK